VLSRLARSFHDPILPTTGYEQLADWLGPEGPQLYAGGHTHHQMLRRFRETLVLNPGSIGLPLDRFPDPARNPAWAEYALVTVEGRRLSVDLRRAPYDVAALRAAIFACGMPYADVWSADWF
jgi:predicted phosphodiesterase